MLPHVQTDSTVHFQYRSKVLIILGVILSAEAGTDLELSDKHSESTASVDWLPSTDACSGRLHSPYAGSSTYDLHLLHHLPPSCHPSHLLRLWFLTQYLYLGSSNIKDIAQSSIIPGIHHLWSHNEQNWLQPRLARP